MELLLQFNFKEYELKDINVNVEEDSLNLSNGKQTIILPLYPLLKNIKKAISDEVDFKIEINNQIIYSNKKKFIYTQELKNNLNQGNILIVKTALNSFNFIRLNQISKFMLIAWIFFILSNLFLLSNGTKLILKKYKLLLISKYRKKLYLFKNVIQKQEYEILKQKWDQDLKIKKDTALNYIFLQNFDKIKVAQLQGVDFLKSLNKFPESFCTIKVKNLIVEIFKLDNDLKLIFECNNKDDITFRSEVLFYQLIYSMIKNLDFYFLKHKLSKPYIKLVLNVVNSRLDFQVSFPGTKFDSLSNEYLSHHANPFILTFNCIFDTFKEEGYEYTLLLNESQNKNVINIYHPSSKIFNNDNIVFFNSKLTHKSI